MNWRMILFIMTIILGTYNKTSAQLNVQVGFDLAYFPLNQLNAVLQDHNETVDYTSSFGDIHFLNGLLLGFEYRGDQAGIHFNVNGKFDGNRANRKVNGEDIENNIKLRYLSGSLGLTGYFGQLGLGASMNYHLNNTLLQFESPKTDHTDKWRGWSSTLFMDINFPGADNISLTLRPYYQYHWNDWNISGIRSEIGAVSSSLNEQFSHFGLTILFKNSF